MGGEITRDEFAQLLSDFTHSAESGDGARFARHFHRGREMLARQDGA
jgi:hypothetical protein